MKYSEKTFLEKIKSADATIEMMDFFYYDETNYKHEGTDCYIKLNGFFHVTDFETDLNSSYNTFINELVVELNSIELKANKLKRLFDIHTEIHNIRALLFLKKGEQGDYFKHKNFTTKNDSPQEEYLDRVLGEHEVQEFYTPMNNYLNLTIDKIQMMQDLVKLESDRISILPVEQPKSELKKIKLSISTYDLGAFIALMIKAGIIDSNASVDLAKTISQSFSTKQSGEVLSEKAIRNRITTPEVKSIDSARLLAANMVTSAKNYFN